MIFYFLRKKWKFKKCIYFQTNILLNGSDPELDSNLFFGRSRIWIRKKHFESATLLTTHFFITNNCSKKYNKFSFFQSWALCTSDGCGVYFEPYCGRHTNIGDAGMGQGPNVVVDLIQKAELSPGCDVYFDNLFTSFPLLTRLSEMGIAGTGTVRQNRLHNVPIIGKKEMQRKAVERGTQQEVYKEDQLLVCWKDNKPVYMATNKYSAQRSTTVSRFCRIQRKKIQVPIPELIKKYNISMGGVDLLDNMVACYRVPYRIKKWWFAIFSWSLSVSAVNAWRLRRQVTGNKEPFLVFLRELVMDLLWKHGTPPTRKRVSSGPTSSLEARYDCLSHWIVSTEADSKGVPKRRNCKQCSDEGRKDNKTLLMCEKCVVPLHHHCFKEKDYLPLENYFFVVETIPKLFICYL